MSRIIKFRGKSAQTKEFVYGSLINGKYILEDGSELLDNDWVPDYHPSGMGCGLEDRNITDRYAAMEHGFEKCIEKYQEMLPVFIEVIPETVGELTGLTDKDGKEIYEGDILRLHEYGEIDMPVVFHKGAFCIHGFNWQVSTCEVIGNIHETPDPHTF